MNLVKVATDTVERTALPDVLTRFGIGMLVGRTGRRLARSPEDDDAAFARAMGAFPVAEHADAANAQHYELPPEFFTAFLGPRLKYSCCLYPTGKESLAEAEIKALEETVAHADLVDGQHVLELGCGWGSLTLFMAERFPGARITAVSNSGPQRMHIEAEARRRQLGNIRVITADMNDFRPEDTFDRIVSVEMFEHMANWRELLARARSWVKPDGALFLHVFSHKTSPYRFDHRNKADWIAQHFFTGGIMPSHGLIRQFGDLFAPVGEWRWSGHHYALTALDWLANFDADLARIDPILSRTYGRDAVLWRRRWRLFFLATAGLFGYRGGDDWAVSHYLLKPAGA